MFPFLYEVTLTRDDVTQPWGFSLAGGRQVFRDLFVSRLLTCTAADGKLEPGEIVVGINGYDVRTATLLEATSLVKQAGYQLVLIVDRRELEKVIVLHTPTEPSSW